jgi:hypothetical protein
VVETAGSRAAGAVVNLDLEPFDGNRPDARSLPPTCSNSREDIHAAVRSCTGHDVNPQLEVAEAVIARRSVVLACWGL